MEAPNAASSAPTQDTPPPALTAVEQTVVNDDVAGFRAARAAERAGKPLEPPAPVQSDAADAETTETVPAAPAPAPERQLSKRQIEANERTREAVERATADAQAEIARLKAQLAAPPAPRSEPKTESAPVEDSAPDPTDTTKYPAGEYDPKYLTDLVSHQVAVKLKAERAEAEAARAKEAADAESLRVAQEWKTKADAATVKHPDFEAVAINAPSAIKPGSVAFGWIVDSPLGAEVLYHLQKNKAEQTRILALPAYQQIRELVKLEDSFSTPAPKTVTDAPDPPTALGTRPVDPGDPKRAAVLAGDDRAYRETRRQERLAQRGHR